MTRTDSFPWFIIKAWAIAIIAVFFLALFASYAFAQAAAPAAPPVGGEGILDVVRSSVITGTVSLFGVLLTVLSSYAPKWITANIDLKTTMEAMHWETYLTTATGKCFDYAAAKLGLTPDKITTWSEKNAFLRFAFEFLEAHHGDIIAYVDKDGNGVMDVLETALAKIAPGAPLADATPKPQAAAPQGLMGSPPRRGVKIAQPDADTASVATTFAAKSSPKLSGARAMGSA